MTGQLVKFAARHLIKNRAATILNMIGLFTAFSAAVLVYLWIYSEITFDKFFSNHEQLYQVKANVHEPNGINTIEGTSPFLGESLKNEVPEILLSTTTTPANWFKKFSINNGSTAIKANGNFASADFFEVFPYELIDGVKHDLLQEKNGIVISEALALKLFGTTSDIVGRNIEWKWFSYKSNCVITGVFKDAPANATYQYDFILPLGAWNDIVSLGNSDNLGGGPFNTYVVLKEGTSIALANKKISDFITKRVPGSTSYLFLEKYSRRHLHGVYQDGREVGGRFRIVQILGAVAILLIVMACFNFMNLSTADASNRKKEIAVKKIVGASRWNLFGQFITEASLVSFGSMMLALLCLPLILPWFNKVTGTNLVMDFSARLIFPLGIAALLTGLLAGIYPAIYLSTLDNIGFLRKLIRRRGSELAVRKGLTIFQFSLSVFLIVSAIVVNSQLKLIHSKDLGYEKDSIIYFEMEGDVPNKLDLFLSQLKKIRGVEGVSSAQNTVVLPSSNIQATNQDINNPEQFNHLAVNYELLETLDIKIKAGRTFSREYGTDSDAVVLNEAAIAALGLQDPIGESIEFWGVKKRIIGVCKNFHFNSLHHKIAPFVFRLEPSSTLLVLIRINTLHGDETLGLIKQFYESFNPGYVFDYATLAGDYERQHSSEIILGRLSMYLTVLAILIACLGLYGLLTYSLEQRKKEVTIRKVLGAKVYDIIRLVSSDFSSLLAISILLSFPLAWMALNKWLEGFAYRTALGSMPFLLAAGFISIITVYIICIKAIRLATENPAKNL